MHIFSTLITITLLFKTEPVLGGSRFWESKAPNQRTNLTPYYEDLLTLNSTSRLVKRAMSIQNLPNDNSAKRIWPNKKLKYCFAETPSPLFRGAWDLARTSWPGLERHGFTYERVGDDTCPPGTDRGSVLRIHYNNVGVLKSTYGIPVVDASADENDPNAVLGPYTNLSDSTTVGMGDIVANMAHEIGHIWGLYHEHQIPFYWEVSGDNMLDGWNFQSGDADTVKRFETKHFACSSLSDYDKVQLKFDKLIEKAGDDEKKDLIFDRQRLCISRVVANQYGFSALDWLPLEHVTQMVADEEFDPDSIMLYPSKSGGKGAGGDDRELVMTYNDGSEIKPRFRPSPMDYERLIVLYGEPAPSTLEVPHTSGSSDFLSKLKKARSFNELFKRAGDTKDGMCKK
ncbi:hypothetical protein J4E89_010033 [Alternaria sp. Ai002NY15]|nr:hypothetical protein J4E89_010033 [Alternaria sp. Ai002NY15]